MELHAGNGRLQVDRQPFDEDLILGKVDVDVFIDDLDDLHDQGLHLLIGSFAAVDVLLASHEVLGQIIDFTGRHVDTGLAKDLFEHRRRHFKFPGLLQILRLAQGVHHGIPLLGPADGNGRVDDQIVDGHVGQMQLIGIADTDDDVQKLGNVDIGKEALEIGHLTGVAGLEEVILRDEVADLPFIAFKAHAFGLIGPDGKAILGQSLPGFLQVAL